MALRIASFEGSLKRAQEVFQSESLTEQIEARGGTNIEKASIAMEASDNKFTLSSSKQQQRTPLIITTEASSSSATITVCHQD